MGISPRLRIPCALGTSGGSKAIPSAAREGLESSASPAIGSAIPSAAREGMEFRRGRVVSAC